MGSQRSVIILLGITRYLLPVTSIYDISQTAHTGEYRIDLGLNTYTKSK
jgi:hypothetical protein